MRVRDSDTEVGQHFRAPQRHGQGQPTPPPPNPFVTTVVVATMVVLLSG